MKHHSIVHRGCPVERDYVQTCDQKNNGQKCGLPAISYDPERGFVCERHHVATMRFEALGFKVKPA